MYSRSPRSRSSRENTLSSQKEKKKKKEKEKQNEEKKEMEIEGEEEQREDKELEAEKDMRDEEDQDQDEEKEMEKTGLYSFTLGHSLDTLLYLGFYPSVSALWKSIDENNNYDTTTTAATTTNTSISPSFSLFSTLSTNPTFEKRMKICGLEEVIDDIIDFGTIHENYFRKEDEDGNPNKNGNVNIEGMMKKKKEKEEEEDKINEDYWTSLKWLQYYFSMDVSVSNRPDLSNFLLNISGKSLYHKIMLVVNKECTIQSILHSLLIAQKGLNKRGQDKQHIEEEVKNVEEEIKIIIDKAFPTPSVLAPGLWEEMQSVSKEMYKEIRLELLSILSQMILSRTTAAVTTSIATTTTKITRGQKKKELSSNSTSSQSTGLSAKLSVSQVRYEKRNRSQSNNDNNDNDIEDDSKDDAEKKDTKGGMDMGKVISTMKTTLLRQNHVLFNFFPVLEEYLQTLKKQLPRPLFSEIVKDFARVKEMKLDDYNAMDMETLVGSFLGRPISSHESIEKESMMIMRMARRNRRNKNRIEREQKPNQGQGKTGKLRVLDEELEGEGDGKLELGEEEREKEKEKDKGKEKGLTTGKVMANINLGVPPSLKGLDVEELTQTTRRTLSRQRQTNHNNKHVKSSAKKWNGKVLEDSEEGEIEEEQKKKDEHKGEGQRKERGDPFADMMETTIMALPMTQIDGGDSLEEDLFPSDIGFDPSDTQLSTQLLIEEHEQEQEIIKQKQKQGKGKEEISDEEAKRKLRSATRQLGENLATLHDPLAASLLSSSPQKENQKQKEKETDKETEEEKQGGTEKEKEETEEKEKEKENFQNQSDLDFDGEEEKESWKKPKPKRTLLAELFKKQEEKRGKDGQEKDQKEKRKGNEKEIEKKEKENEKQPESKINSKATTKSMKTSSTTKSQKKKMPSFFEDVAFSDSDDTIETTSSEDGSKKRKINNSSTSTSNTKATGGKRMFGSGALSGPRANAEAVTYDSDDEDEDNKDSKSKQNTQKKKETSESQERKKRKISLDSVRPVRNAVVAKSISTSSSTRPRAQPPAPASGRISWSQVEIQYLKRGVEVDGLEGQWARILAKYKNKFHYSRDSVSLKDKWRNLARTRSK